MAPFRIIREAQVLLEAAPRKAAIDALVKEGYSRKAAVVKGNQVLVDYAMLSDQASDVRRLVAPFIAWPLQTASNFLKFPVRSAASVLPRMAAFYTSLHMANWLLTPDQEAAQDPDLQASPHLNLGRKDEHGRWVSVDFRNFGVDLPTPYKAVVWAAGKAVAAMMGEELGRELDRVSDAGLGQASKEASGAFSGPVPAGYAALRYGVDARTGAPLETAYDARLPAEEKAKKNALRFGVATDDTRTAAALAPFAGPLKTYNEMTQPDALKREDRTRRLLGDPVRRTEPFARTLALRRSEMEPALHALGAAIDRNDSAEAKKLMARLAELRVTGKSVKAFLRARARARAQANLPPEQQRATLNARYGPIQEAGR